MKVFNQHKIILGVMFLVLFFTLVVGAIWYNNQYYARKVIAAIEQEDVSTLEKLADSHFGNLNCKPTLWLVEVMSEKDELTPLQTACDRGNPLVVKMLLENGADVNYTHWDKRRNNGSALTMAAGSLSKERLQVVRILVEAGADVNYVSYTGNDALSCAVYAAYEREDTIELIEYLEQYGADVHKKYSGTQNTLLHKGCEQGALVVVKYLVEQRGFNINEVNADGDTALIYFMRFASQRNKEVLLFLLENGADTDIKNNEGKTVYDYAIERHPELIEILESETK